MTPDQLPERWREDYEERAAIMEYDGNMTRAVAETKAMADVVKRMTDELLEVAQTHNTGVCSNG